MRPATHSIALTLLGFTAGAVVVYGLDRLPSIETTPVPAQTAASPTTVPDAATLPGFADAVTAAAPAVVKVYGRSFAAGGPGPPTPASPPMRAATISTGHQGRPHTRLGSGVVIRGNGLIVTNGHVVRALDRIQVELADGRQAPAALLGIDEATDLAVLRVPLDDLPTVEIGDPGRLRTGDVVLAIGNPFGLGQTVSLGIVSATGRSQLGLTAIEDFIQTDAAINPGNSGGALVDISGRLVGIATAGVTESGHSQGLGLAIPATLVMQVVETLATHAAVDRGWIGLGGRSVTSELEERFGLRAAHGVLVARLSENGPAATAGIRAGDVITAYDEIEVDDALQLQELIAATAPGTEVRLVVWRGSQRLEVALRTAAWKPPPDVDANRRVGPPTSGAVSGDHPHQASASLVAPQPDLAPEGPSRPFPCPAAAHGC
jgi:serine protease DegS